MGTLFISHSSRDNEAAIKIRNWLRSNGWVHVFLDLDPVSGLVPGQLWQQELKQSGERCSAVILLVSPDWVTSRWCQTEFLVADQLGKKIFPVVIAPTPLDDVPIELRARFQMADISTPEIEVDGFERLALGLKRAGLDPSSFEWPPRSDPQRPIYRGLRSLDEQDAAIFFGRDALITKGLDALRRMRDGAPERMLVILGASGAGKSSFMKAGLLARLRRDAENFLVLPVIRPGLEALSGKLGVAAVLKREPRQLKEVGELVKAFAELRAESMNQLRHVAEDVPAADAVRSPTIIIAVDQAEELFSIVSGDATWLLEFLTMSIRADDNLIVIATIRSDAFAQLQNDARLSEVARVPFDLSPIPAGAFKEVIEGPARLAQPALAVDPALTDRLLMDLGSEDALPLLAFTLERLTLRRRSGGTLTVHEYLGELGGLQGAITAAVDEAFAIAERDPTLPKTRTELEKLARTAFVPALVRLENADSEPRRRQERIEALPEATKPLIRHLVDQHLLVSARNVIDGHETHTVEVAHEAILRQWSSLRAWISEERNALRAVEILRSAAAEWHMHENEESNDQRQSWLLHRGARLQEAEDLLTQLSFKAALSSTELEYLTSCRENENNDRHRERMGIARTRKLQRRVGRLLAFAAVVVLLAGAGIAQLMAGMAVRASELLATQAARQSDIGNYDLGARYALSGLSEVDWPFLTAHGVQAKAELAGASVASSALMVLRGHVDQVLSAAFSPDGKRIVTTSRDATARIWDASTARIVAVLSGHRREVTSAKFSPDGARVVTSSADGTARLWDAQTSRMIFIFRGHEDAVVSVAFSPDGRQIITASRDHTARMWDTNSGRQLAVFRGHEDQLESAEFSPNGKRIVTASDDGTARIWDATTARQISVLRGHESTLENANFSPDGKRIVTASDDLTARIWDAISARQILVLHGHQKAVITAVFSPDGDRVITASQDQTARIWDSADGHQIDVLRGHSDAVNSAAFSFDGARAVTSSDDGTARVWDVGPTHRVVVLRGHTNGVNSVAFSPDDRHVVTGSTDKTAAIWDASTGRRIVVLYGHQDLVETAIYSPDGSRIVTASDDKTARIWDANSGRELQQLRGHNDKVESAAFSPDGSWIVTASADDTARIWNARTARQSSILHGHKKTVVSAVFSPDGRRIATASADETVRIWDRKSGREIAMLRGNEGAPTSVMFDALGARIAVAYRDKTVGIWNANTMREVAILRGHEGVAVTVAFSRDGSRIVTASRDRTARIWDANASSEVAVLRGHEGPVNGAAFSADGRRVATASDDNTARLWNVATIGSISRPELIQQACQTTLAHGLSRFSAGELRDAPVLDPILDVDVCKPPSLLERLERVLLASRASAGLN